MTIYYKATRPDGTDFRTGTIDYGAALASGNLITHPRNMLVRQRMTGDDAGNYLSVATVPTDCTGMSWPCRLFEVEPVGRLWDPRSGFPNKRACHTLRVVGEVEGWRALGPQGREVVAVIGRARALTHDEALSLDAARDAAWDAARAAAGDAARDATWDAARAAAWDAAGDAAWDAARAAARAAAWDAAWDAARDAAWALTIRDLIGDTFTQTHYNTLTRPWATTIRPVHPDDRPVS